MVCGDMGRLLDYVDPLLRILALLHAAREDPTILKRLYEVLRNSMHVELLATVKLHNEEIGVLDANELEEAYVNAEKEREKRCNELQSRIEKYMTEENLGTEGSAYDERYNFAIDLMRSGLYDYAIELFKLLLNRDLSFDSLQRLTLPIVTCSLLAQRELTFDVGMDIRSNFFLLERKLISSGWVLTDDLNVVDEESYTKILHLFSYGMFVFVETYTDAATILNLLYRTELYWAIIRRRVPELIPYVANTLVCARVDIYELINFAKDSSVHERLDNPIIQFIACVTGNFDLSTIIGYLLQSYIFIYNNYFTQAYCEDFVISATSYIMLVNCKLFQRIEVDQLSQSITFHAQALADRNPCIASLVESMETWLSRSIAYSMRQLLYDEGNKCFWKKPKTDYQSTLFIENELRKY